MLIKWEEMRQACGLGWMRLRARAAELFREEQGDLVSSLGWMALMALALVLIKGIVDGGITSYANNIFSHLNRVFTP